MQSSDFNWYKRCVLVISGLHLWTSKRCFYANLIDPTGSHTESTFGSYLPPCFDHINFRRLFYNPRIYNPRILQ